MSGNLSPQHAEDRAPAGGAQNDQGSTDLNFDTQVRCSGDHHPKIHNHDIMNCTEDGVLGNYLYSGRGLGLTFPGDVIQLHPDHWQDWKTIGDHYDRIGLPFTRNVIWDVHPQHLQSYPDHDISVFFYDDIFARYRSNPSWQNAVEQLNSKNSFMKVAQSLGVPVPSTRCYSSRENFTGLEGISFPCYLKAAISVAGIGIYRVTTEIELNEALATFDSDTPVQIQEEVVTDTFLNMQYRVSENGLERVLTSEQVLNGYTHMGNRYPASCEPWEVVDPLAEWMFDHGMQGIFAFDVAVIDTPDGRRFAAIECNPRYNGASYPTGIACKLGLKEWYSEQFHTNYRSLSSIDLRGIEFDPQSGEGIVFVNWGCMKEGVIGVLFSGDENERLSLRQEFKNRL